MIDSIRILGKPFSVRVIPDSSLDAQSRGSIMHNKAEIEVLGGMSDASTRETLLHEVIHAVERGLHLELSEQQVHALSVGLWAVAQESPKQMRYILGLKAGKAKAGK